MNFRDTKACYLIQSNGTIPAFQRHRIHSSLWRSYAVAISRICQALPILGSCQQQTYWSCQLVIIKKLKKVVGCCQITSNYYVSLGIAIVHFIHQTSDSKPLTLLNQGVPREATGIWPKYALETVKRWHWHLGPGLEHPSAGFLCCRGMGSLHIAMKRRSMGSIRLKEWIKLWFWCFFGSFAKKF